LLSTYNVYWYELYYYNLRYRIRLTYMIRLCHFHVLCTALKCKIFRCTENNLFLTTYFYLFEQLTSTVQVISVYTCLRFYYFYCLIKISIFLNIWSTVILVHNIILNVLKMLFVCWLLFFGVLELGKGALVNYFISILIFTTFWWNMFYCDFIAIGESSLAIEKLWIWPILNFFNTDSFLLVLFLALHF